MVMSTCKLVTTFHYDKKLILRRASGTKGKNSLNAMKQLHSPLNTIYPLLGWHGLKFDDILNHNRTSKMMGK